MNPSYRFACDRDSATTHVGSMREFVWVRIACIWKGLPICCLLYMCHLRPSSNAPRNSSVFPMWPKSPPIQRRSTNGVRSSSPSSEKSTRRSELGSVVSETYLDISVWSRLEGSSRPWPYQLNPLPGRVRDNFRPKGRWPSIEKQTEHLRRVRVTTQTVVRLE